MLIDRMYIFTFMIAGATDTFHLGLSVMTSFTIPRLAAVATCCSFDVRLSFKCFYS